MILLWPTWFTKSRNHGYSCSCECNLVPCTLWLLISIWPHFHSEDPHIPSLWSSLSACNHKDTVLHRGGKMVRICGSLFLLRVLGSLFFFNDLFPPRIRSPQNPWALESIIWYCVPTAKLWWGHFQTTSSYVCRECVEVLDRGQLYIIAGKGYDSRTTLPVV